MDHEKFIFISFFTRFYFNLKKKNYKKITRNAISLLIELGQNFIKN